jgi:hypothetical protein
VGLQEVLHVGWQVGVPAAGAYILPPLLAVGVKGSIKGNGKISFLAAVRIYEKN